jgi:hypothetical protein
MERVCRSVGMLVITIVVAGAVSGQEVTKTTTEETTTTTTSSAQVTDKDYVFPSSRERFKRYVSSTVGPMRLLRTGASAGVAQWRDSPEEWCQGMKGYGKRFASGMGQNAIQQTVSYGLDEAFNLDSGFVKSKREGFFPRMKDALMQNVTSRTKSGKRVISVSRFAGAYAGGITATETWYPERYGYKDGLRIGTTTLLAGFGINLMREFVFNF